jgi:dynein heavy chain 1
MLIWNKSNLEHHFIKSVSRSLESCAYSANILKETLNKIQKAVDDLSLRQYSNLHAWVGKLDEAVEAKLALRLQVSYRNSCF